MEMVKNPTGATNQKPLVISSTKYKQILSTFDGENALRKDINEEKRFKDHLRHGPDQIVATWSGSFKRTQGQTQTEKTKKFEDKVLKEKQEYLQIRQKDEQIRREKIAKAEELIQKLKPGTKELHIAAIQRETLKGRAVQRNIDKEFEKIIKKHTAEEQFHVESQDMQWIYEEQRRISNEIHRNNKFKAELLNTIDEESSMKMDRSRIEMAQNKMTHDVCNKEIKAQIERELDFMKRKREDLRRNALEAMILVEQRKAREHIKDNVEEKLNTIFNDGKENIESINKAREGQARQDHAARNAPNVPNWVTPQTDTTKTEEERLRKNIRTVQLQFTAQEREKVQRSRQQKFARIQEYYKELNTQKERKTEHARFALANLLKNEKVNATFNQKQSEEKMKTSNLRKTLTEQVEQRKQTEAEERSYDMKCTTVDFEKEDNVFFDYANNLVTEAVRKERPLYPFVKTVQQYKKDNGIDVDRKLPPHLESHLPIEVKKPLERDVVPIARKYGLMELKKLNPSVKKSLFTN